MDTKLMSPEELSEWTGIPKGTLAQWRYLRRGPRYFSLGRHVRYDVADVKVWLAENAQMMEVSR